VTERVDPVLEAGWKAALEAEFGKEYFFSLKQFLLDEKSRSRVFPPGSLIFNAFNHTPFDRVKVVLLGQDPYHGAGQAHGLCFSVPEGVAKPPSLINIFKELRSDLDLPKPSHGNLTAWADRGVLLLNATLTVRENQAGSHQNRGWETFTNEAIRQLSARRKGLVFLLWGNFAIAKQSLIDTSRHSVLTSVHPSPLSAHRGFFGCRHFSKTNEILQRQGDEVIDWRL
jgi:uracil-DNA glycosylase